MTDTKFEFVDRKVTENGVTFFVKSSGKDTEFPISGPVPAVQLLHALAASVGESIEIDFFQHETMQHALATTTIRSGSVQHSVTDGDDSSTAGAVAKSGIQALNAVLFKKMQSNTARQFSVDG